MILYGRRFTTEKLVEGKKKEPFLDDKLPGGDKYLDYLNLTKEACALSLLDVSNHIFRVTTGVFKKSNLSVLYTINIFFKTDQNKLIRYEKSTFTNFCAFLHVIHY